MYRDIIKSNLSESLSKYDKDDIKSEVIKTLKSDDLKAVISTLIAREIKNNKELENYTVDITRNVITQLFKALWTKRSAWQSSLTNKTS